MEAAQGIITQNFIYKDDNPDPLLRVLQEEK